MTGSNAHKAIAVCAILTPAADLCALPGGSP